MARSRQSKKSRGFLVQKPLGQVTDRVQAVGPEHFGVVSIDPAKSRSKILLCDFYGQVLIEPTWVEHTQSALQAACQRVRSVMNERGLHDIVVAVERTGTYHRPVQDAFRRATFETRLVHPFASKQFRQPGDSDDKTDDTDLGGIFRAAVNGFGLRQPVWPDVYLHLQHLSRQRRDLVCKTTILRCQIKETLHQLMPGYAELFGAHFFDTPVALPLARATGSAQAVLEAGLNGLPPRLPEGVRFKMSTLFRVLEWARTAVPPQSPHQLLREQLNQLADDFLQKTKEICHIECRLAHLLVTTPYVRLLALPGICVVSAAELAGEMGPIEHYADANHITGRAGLCPSRYQSDQVDCHGPLRRRANRRLRAVLMRIADNLIRHNHHYQARAHRWQAQNKDPRWMRVKVAKSFSRLGFVMLVGRCIVPHPACQPRHSICEKILAFHSEHKTDIQRALEDIDQINAQLSERTRQEETSMLQEQLDKPGCRRRRGPQAVGKIIPLVLARLGIRMVQSATEEEDSN
jgi:transposase